MPAENAEALFSTQCLFNGFRLSEHPALVADAALAFVGESLHAGENRLGVKMRFRDHFRLETAASPAIVKVGGE